MAKMTKEQRQQKKLAALLGLEAPTALSNAQSQARSMEAEAGLAYYENPRSFQEKNCKHCGDSFATRGSPVAFCSDPCRIKEFEERMGVKWQPLRPASERWSTTGEPLTVPHEALVVIQSVMIEQQVAREEAESIEVPLAVEPDLLDIFDEFGL